jgi:hypothetical protein
MRLLGSLLIALMLVVIGGEFHITVKTVVNVAKEITNKISPAIHEVSQDIANSTK